MWAAIGKCLVNLAKLLHMRNYTTSGRGMPGIFLTVYFTAFYGLSIFGQAPKAYDAKFVEGLKKEALTSVAGKEKSVQEMVDMVFSFGELGFQEFETSKYIT